MREKFYSIALLVSPRLHPISKNQNQNQEEEEEEYLSDVRIPFLGPDPDFHRFLHQARGYHHGVDLSHGRASGFSCLLHSLERHFVW